MARSLRKIAVGGAASPKVHFTPPTPIYLRAGITFGSRTAIIG